MDEYIKRSAFIEAVKDIPMWGSAAAMLADSIPAADVVPVVRCMGCKHLVAVNVNGKGIPTCRVSGMEVALDEFCSRGEKGRR